MQTTRRAFLGTVAGGAMASAGGVRRAGAQGRTPVKIGHVVLGDFGINTPTMVALEKGFFKQHGLDAEVGRFVSARAVGLSEEGILAVAA